MNFILLVNILLSEEDCQALHKDPSETVVAHKLRGQKVAQSQNRQTNTHTVGLGAGSVKMRFIVWTMEKCIIC